MNNYNNNNNMNCNCEIERIDGDVMEIFGECVCDNGFEYLKNAVKEIGVFDIIMDYKFEMEADERVEAHKELFEECLDEIVNKRWTKVYNNFEMNMDYNLGYVRIDIEYEIVNIDDGEDILIELELDNADGWCGFNQKELLGYVLRNARNYDEDESFDEYIERMFESADECMFEDMDENDGELRNKYTLWYESMRNGREWADDCLYHMGENPLDRELFYVWIGDNCDY